MSPLRLLALTALLAVQGTGAWAYDLTIIGGIVQGPGPMPDTPLPQGKLGYIVFDDHLTGASEFFNNGAEPPNNPGELEIEGHYGGTLSNGVPFNKHVYGGVVTIGQGALKMLSVIASDGPLKGRETYHLNDQLNWVIHTDLALDAGFPQGLVVSRNITITTGVLFVPPSMRTEGGLKGGMDEAGSLPSGAPIYGMLGDIDGRGFLDGRIVGASRVPLDFMFMPGSPLVMQREIRSNIPVTHEQAGILTFAGLANLRDVLAVAQEESAAPPAARKYVLARAQSYLQDFAARAHSAQVHLAAAGPARAALAAQAGAIEAVLRAQIPQAGGWAATGAVPAANMTAIRASLDDVAKTIPALQSELRFTQIGK
jgi:hypothetical protein